jgi:integrase
MLLLANGHKPDFKGSGSLSAECWEAIERVNLNWHDLRHDGLSRYGELGVSTRALQLLAGHASIQTTLRYEHVTVDRLRTEIAKAVLREDKATSEVAPKWHEPGSDSGSPSLRSA